jgi:glycosyltransferase involved in cell wall biosynthesis
MLVGTKVTADEDVEPIAGRRMKFVDSLFNRVSGKLSLQYLFYPSSFYLLRHKWFRETDIVQLYNTHGNYFSHLALPALSPRHPLVWRLSDMWPMTGHCAYSFGCERWQTGCGSCPILSDRPELYRDTTALLWRIKRWAYSRSRLTIVAPSKWIANLAAQSPLLNSFAIHEIPNGLDTTLFAPQSQAASRRSLEIHPDERVVLFSAQQLSDRRKGALPMKAALARLAETEKNLTLLMVGENGHQIDLPPSLRVKMTGTINDDRRLAAVYSAADVFVLPTLAENLPNGVLESMACGTPPITFDVGGCREAVRHLETGYLANYGDPEDLACGIKLLLDDPDLRRRLSSRSRETAVQEYSLNLQAHRFLSLYSDILKQQSEPSDMVGARY